MLPIFAGRVINPSRVINKGHSLVANSQMVAAYRFTDCCQNGREFRDLIGTNHGTLLLDARCYGPDGPVAGASGRQATSQFPRIPSTIWNSLSATTDFTMGFWAKFNAFPNLGAVIDSTNRDFSIFVGGGSPTTSAIQVYHGAVGTISMTMGVTLQQDTWYRMLVGISGNSAITVWVDGIAVASNSIIHGGVLIFGDAIDIGNNTSGGGNQFDGLMGDVFLWNKKLTDISAAYDYQEALQGFPGLFPRHNIWRRAPVASGDATATVGTIGTITLTAPTVAAYNVTDATGTVGSIGTITLTAPTCQAGESNTGTVGSIGVITFTAPTVTGGALDNTGVVDRIGTIYFQAPTVHPIGPPLPHQYGSTVYWGRHERGGYLNLILELPELPEDIPIADIWNGTTLIESVEVPVLEPEDFTFGLPLFLSSDYDDGNYQIVFRFVISTINFAEFAMFEVIGGTATEPVISMVEIERSLGQGVVSHTNDGVVHMGYNPSLNGELS